MAAQFDIAAEQTVKTLLVEADPEHSESTLVALVLRGDHQLNEIKAEKIAAVANPLTLASEEQIRQTLGCSPGSIGPIGLPLPLFVDCAAAATAAFVCGANRDGEHYRNGDWQRDGQSHTVADLRCVVAGDPSPDGKGKLVIKRGIEVGHIFQLGKKYSEALGATVLNEAGKSETVSMGCYGIGVSRVVAAAIEQNHDDSGIIWPTAIAPFALVIVTINGQKSERVRETAESLYQQCIDSGIDVLLDDRNERPGVKFADMELIGIPHRLVVGDKGLDRQVLEYRGRRDESNTDFPVEQAIKEIKQRLK